MNLVRRKSFADKIVLVLLLIGTVLILSYNQKLQLNEKYENEIFLQTMELGNEQFELAVWNATLHDEGVNDVVIHWWKNKDVYYLFLPKSWINHDVFLVFNKQESIEVSGLGEIENGTKIAFSQGRYELLVEEQIVPVEVMYSSEIGTLFVETSKKDMAKLHESKDNSDTGEYAFFDKGGKEIAIGEIESFFCRGNISFERHEKKSYSIHLKEKADLLGGGESKKWILVSNDVDATLMRNKLVDRMGREAEIAYMPDMNWVDLYIDGEYYGNYLLSEKVDVAENSVDIYNLEDEIEKLNADMDYKKDGKREEETPKLRNIMWHQIDIEPECFDGGYLLELELPYRYSDEESGFLTSRRQSVVIISPTYASYNQVNYIGNLYQEFEDAVYSENGYNAYGKHYEDYIDIKSFVRYYLIDEITKQLDAAKTSFFIFKEHNESKLVAGPLWDYDNSIWSNHRAEVATPEGLFAATEKDETVGYDLWYGMYQQQEFRDDVRMEYWNVLREIACDLGKEWIPDAEELIKDSAYMNYVRWHLKEDDFDYTRIKQTYSAEVERMRDFLFSRIEYLDSEWQEE